MREKLIRFGLFTGVIVAALAAIVLLNEPKGFGTGGGREEAVVPSGEQGTLSPALPAFSAVTLSVPARIDVTVGADQAVTITGDRALLARLELEVTDGSLEIRPKRNLRIRKGHGLKVTIAVPSLSAFTVNGAAEGEIRGLSGGSFTLTVNGAGDLDVAGACDSLALTINGAGNVDASRLRCAEARAIINGAGNAELHARERVTAAINGAGNIRIHGNPPVVHANKTGFGRVELVPDADERTEG